MEPLAFVIAILGCGDAGAGCERLSVQPARYASQSACLAATDAALRQNTHLPFPVITARCEQRGFQIAAKR